MRILKINKKYAGYVSHHEDGIVVFEQPNDSDMWTWNEVAAPIKDKGKWTMKSAQRYAQRATRSNMRVKICYQGTRRYVPLQGDI